MISLFLFSSISLHATINRNFIAPFQMKWIGEMREQPFVKENKSSYERFARHAETVRLGQPEYDI